MYNESAAAFEKLGAMLRSAKGTSKIGGRMVDGTVYAGSLDGKQIYTTREDAPLVCTFNEAADHAAALNREKFLGHDDWRVPTKDESRRPVQPPCGDRRL